MATFGKKVAPLEKRIGEDSNQNKTFGKKVANVGKVGHNLCKKGCLQPLQKKVACSLWKKGCGKLPVKKQTFGKQKGVLYILWWQECAANSHWKKWYMVQSLEKRHPLSKQAASHRTFGKKVPACFCNRLSLWKKGMARHQSAKNCSADLVWQSFSVSKPQSLHIPSQAKSSCCHSACPPHCHLK